MNRRRFLFGVGAGAAAVTVPAGFEVKTRSAAKIRGPETSGGAPLVRLTQEYDINTDRLLALASLRRRGKLYYVNQELPDDSSRDASLERAMVQALLRGAKITRPVRVEGSIRSSGDRPLLHDPSPRGRWFLPDSAAGRS